MYWTLKDRAVKVGRKMIGKEMSPPKKRKKQLGSTQMHEMYATIWNMIWKWL